MASPYEQMTKDDLLAEVRRLQGLLAQPTQLSSSPPPDEAEPAAEHFAESQFTRASQASLAEESPNHFANLNDFAPVPYAVLSVEGVVLEINRAGAELLGLEQQQIVNQSLARFIGPEDADRWQEHLRRCQSGELRVLTSLSLKCRLQRLIPVQLTTRTAPHGPDAVPVLHTAMTDLTEQKQAEQALRESEERLKLAQEAAGVGIWDWDMNTDEAQWSEQHFHLLGLDPEVARPGLESWFGCLHPQDREGINVEELLSGVRGNPTLEMEYRIVRPEGEVRTLVSRGRATTSDKGPAQRVVGITIDITDLKRAEQRLQELNDELKKRSREAEQRGVQLRRLTLELTQAEQRERRQVAQVLHDHLQQLLVAGKLRLGWLRGRTEDEQVREAIHQVDQLLLEAIEASRSLTVELSPPILYDGGLAQALEWLGRQMQEKHGLKVEVQTDPRVDPLNEDIRALLYHTVRELLFNVVKHADITEACVVMGVGPNDRVQIEVRDAGAGFDPLSEAGKRGECGGFGLFSIEERLEILGGTMDLESEPGRGTCVRLTVPRSTSEIIGRHGASEFDRPVSPPAARRDSEWWGSQSAASEGTIRVLLADDHKLVREGLAGLLRDFPDIEVVGEASTGEDAVEQARLAAPDVVVMDVSMPGMSGIDAARLITAEFPACRVIGLSMHEKEEMAHAMFDAGAAVYLSKGGLADDLIAAIRGEYRVESLSKEETPGGVA